MKIKNNTVRSQVTGNLQLNIILHRVIVLEHVSN